ncbi:UDP-N-acetylmuramoyl-tripeptide--D-alanyl-D-alanine ligase [Neptuniibacter sp. CAU 1671]|uniref:UDP-N-acetylmuramoyl-tripeptide--D-alanyl-D- alanine ligase n=1 Tax=Neptuniibacter sp. CAU 1671 TaxID=3032593 RepID=UPI0023DB85F3|nr:UDP-N-acetylmuramoyl-tripeptide--D-alanyl-D-alanine ligase [Neptuniibacter sp. CAU 1671]MDF2181536.1 UDP-N-acetylmuramoyl-tripeptide--D-alanyl-D-alanine ligase [Neptuniibacter sp. CAU 1671]
MIGHWHLSDLSSQFGGVVSEDANFVGVSTDTRTLQPGDLFVAIVGPNFNGHNFVAQAEAAGAAALVVSQPVVSRLPQWQVNDTRIALGQIGLANRNRFQGPVYAVTGSSGKTTVKEMLLSILSGQRKVLATKGNLNNDFGVPLTLMQLDDTTEVAVIEQGASAVGEIAYTTALVQPDVAILNNAMGAHLEGFGSLQGVVRAKGEIFGQLAERDGTAVINLDDPHASVWLQQTALVRQKTFSLSNSQADCYASELKPGANGCYRFKLHLGDRSAAVQLQVMGQHNVANALAAAAAVHAGGLTLPQIVVGLERFSAVKGRMRPCQSAQGALIIDDSYNANPGSVHAAIDLLAALPGESFLVLGDMAELGESAEEAHTTVGCRAALKGIRHLWVTGVLSRHTVSGYNTSAGTDGQHFADKAELIAALEPLAKAGVNILVKGSRSAGMEQVVAGLEQGE